MGANDPRGMTNLDPRGMVFSFKFYLYNNSTVINDPQGMANLDFRDMFGRIYVGDH